MPDSPSGEVVATHGRRCLVRLAGTTLDRAAMLRGRQIEVCVGDQVRCTRADADQLVVESVHERTNLVLRSVGHKRKLLAANIDQAFIVIAPVPRYAEEILLRVMIAMRHAGVRLNLLANKADLPQFAQIRDRLASLARLDVPVIEVSARVPEAAVALVAPLLTGRRSLLLGESGMGKSTLLNLLVPDAGQRTNEIPRRLAADVTRPRPAVCSMCPRRLRRGPASSIRRAFSSLAWRICRRQSANTRCPSSGPIWASAGSTTAGT
ncbi:MAG: GTPase RsgA [Burkholderiaceae bacterium]